MTIGVSIHSSFSSFVSLQSQYRSATNVPESEENSESTRQPSSIRQKTEPTPPSKTSDQVDPSSRLTREELEIVKQLKIRDQQVRAHEQAHLAAAGSLAQGGPSYSYQTGPDGKRYATGGEVSVDTTTIAGDPEATIQKAQQIRRAALAPAQPSSADLQVAAQAATMEQQALAELSISNQEEKKEVNDRADASSGPDDAACQICGGSHASDTHAEGVQNQLEGSFVTIENFGNDIPNLVNAIDHYA